MKIPRDLPQFKDETAFIIVAGKQNAVFYTAADATIEQVDAFKIPKPKYSDNEGGFETRGRGMLISSGSVRELQDADIIRDFLRELQLRFKKIPAFSRLYIFAPQQTKNKIQKVLPSEWKKKINAIIDGNYYFRHPTFILKKLSESMVYPLSLPGSEAQRMMRKFEH